MKKGKMHKWMLTFAAGGGFIGMIIGNLLTGSLDISVVLGALTALVLMFIIDLIRNRLKKDKTPDFDERTVNNMMKYYAIIANIFIAILFIGLAILSFMEIESIEISYLFIPIVVYLFTSGIGAIIVSRK